MLLENNLRYYPPPRWERARVKGENCHVNPHLNPPPSRGRIIIDNFYSSWEGQTAMTISLKRRLGVVERIDVTVK